MSTDQAPEQECEQDIETQPSLGKILRDRRVELGLSLDDVSERTRIRKVYLQHLDEDRFDLLPGDTYAKGFIRNYASCLCVPWQPLVELYSEVKLSAPQAQSDTVTSTTKLHEPFAISRSGRWLWVVLLMTLLLGLSLFFMSSQTP